jgi:hypothetical protein
VFFISNTEHSFYSSIVLQLAVQTFHLVNTTVLYLSGCIWCFSKLSNSSYFFAAICIHGPFYFVVLQAGKFMLYSLFCSICDGV